MISTREFTKGQTPPPPHTHTQKTQISGPSIHTQRRKELAKDMVAEKERETSGHANAPNVWNKAPMARRRPRRAVSSERPELKERTRSGNYQRGTQLCEWN